MKKTRRTIIDLRGSYGLTVLLLGMFIFLSVTFFMTGMAYADDANDSRSGATFTSSTLVLDLPELAVEGTDLLYSAKLQLKQEGENFFLELIELGPCQYQEASEIAATLSADGTLHVPLFIYAGDGSATFWAIDLKLVDTASLLPIRFNINHIVQVPEVEQNNNDDLLGQKKKTTIKVKTPIGTIVVVIEQDDGKSEPKPMKPFTQ